MDPLSAYRAAGLRPVAMPNLPEDTAKIIPRGELEADRGRDHKQRYGALEVLERDAEM